MKALKTYAIVGAALIALGIGGFFAASASAAAPTRFDVQAQSQTPTPSTPGAQRANPHPARLHGNLKAVGANTITLATPRGDVTANIGPNTWIIVQKADGPGQGALSDLKLNTPATVAGMTTNDPKVVDARVVTQGVRDRRQGPRDRRAPKPGDVGRGTIKAINGSTLTVTTNRGFDVQVETTADTVVLDSGFKTPSALKAGDKVQVLGRPQLVNRNARPTRDNLKVTAWGIRVVREGVDLAAGQVASVSGNIVTLDKLRKADNLTVNLSASTQYRLLTISTTDRKATLGNATQSDIKPGTHLVVEGTPSADGKTLNATSVIIVPNKADTVPQV